MKHFVPNHIGVDSLTRKNAITHATTYARSFFGENRVISIWVAHTSIYKKVKTMNWPDKLILYIRIDS